LSDNDSGNAVVGADDDLDQLFAQIEALRELAGDPRASSDPARVYDFSIRWGALISGRLPRLAYYSGRGELSPAQQERFGALCEELLSALPAVDRLGLARPRLTE
jgi:hypothetical protein